LTVYGFKKLKKYIKVINKEMAFYFSLGLVIFIVEYLNGLLAVPSSVPKIESFDMFALFLLNFEFFVFYSLWGIFLDIYNRLKGI